MISNDFSITTSWWNLTVCQLQLADDIKRSVNYNQLMKSVGLPVTISWWYRKSCHCHWQHAGKITRPVNYNQLPAYDINTPVNCSQLMISMLSQQLQPADDIYRPALSTSWGYQQTCYIQLRLITPDAYIELQSADHIYRPCQLH
jgi:hypothetical protein